MKKPLIAITMGDPAGIGPEIIIKALDHDRIYEVCRPVIIGDRGVLTAAAKRMEKSFSLPTIDGIDRVLANKDRAGLIEDSSLNPDEVIPGRPDPRWGGLTLNYIRRAAEAALTRKVEAMVTAPISKDVIRHSQPSFTGHTEFLARLARTRVFGMMLAGERLKVSLVTIHVSLKEVLRLLNRKKIMQTIRLTHQTLTHWFGLRNPRIAIAGLNPHAGEKGAFGEEERTLIAPVVRSAQKQGIFVSGPLPADTLFYWAAQGKYDAVVALYHDQGLIPLKLLHFDRAVNLTMGLPFIRTSVDHGTAFDIAGRGQANPDSLMAAIILAARFARRKV
ncbi:MAG: 4-hydroxythreonine-4-phosphate dehydrogenase PdxA [Thermodesulfobacteriota bacterium]